MGLAQVKLGNIQKKRIDQEVVTRFISRLAIVLTEVAKLHRNLAAELSCYTQIDSILVIPDDGRT